MRKSGKMLVRAVLTLFMTACVFLGLVQLAYGSDYDEITLSVMDMRRSPTSAPLLHRTNLPTADPKILTLKFYTGDLWRHNPMAHLWIMSDGYVDSSIPVKSLQGRGIVVGNTPGCIGVQFEAYGAAKHLPGDCQRASFEDNEFYDIIVYTDSTVVSYRVTGPGVDVGDFAYMQGSFLSNDTVIGVAGDHLSSTYGMFNVRQRIGD